MNQEQTSKEANFQQAFDYLKQHPEVVKNALESRDRFLAEEPVARLNLQEWSLKAHSESKPE
jgi:hypothetical protein